MTDRKTDRQAKDVKTITPIMSEMWGVITQSVTFSPSRESHLAVVCRRLQEHEQIVSGVTEAMQCMRCPGLDSCNYQYTLWNQAKDPLHLPSLDCRSS